ncbi:MAG TPA: hypothetical protein VHL79_23130 [Ramlibacter sp.]|nr:hypothetical protein [Ramlibacter sp.]
MAKKIHLLAAAAMAVVLAACGGGGDDSGTTTTTTETSTGAGSVTPGGSTNTGGTTTGGGTAVAAAIDKYVGTWSHCVPDGNNRYLLDRITVSKTGDNTGTLTYAGTWYTQANCTGTVVDQDGGTGTATIRGQKTVGGVSVDMIEYAEVGQGTFRDIMTVRADGRLYTGVERADSETCRPSATDDCYPTALAASGFVKQ